MVYNKITLAFPGKNEVLFREKYYSDSIFQVRLSLLMVGTLYAVFGYLDSRMVPEYAKLFHIIRYAIVSPTIFLAFILSYTPFFRKIWQLLLFICFIVGGAGISIMTALVPENYAYYAGMMLIFSAGYFFIKLRFFLATTAGWITLMVFNAGAVFYTNPSEILLLNNNFFFISANLIGMFAAYNIEYFARRDFWLNQELDQQKEVVENVNKNLEKIVEERTKDLVEAKNKSDQSDRLKSAFLANMSHEIRTPMNGILGFAELLKEPKLSGDKQQKYIRIIEKSGIRMLNIINSIIDISKIESGMMEVENQASDINEQIDFIYNFFKPELEQKSIQFILNKPLTSQELIIKTDREKVYAILTNLVKNAIKYTAEGSVELGYELKKINQHSYLQFFVKDTGIGIPADRQEAVFERFIQADMSDKKAVQGAGLGLSIARAYVKMLGGKIWLESEVGKGSSFYFTIPYSDPKEEKTLVKNEIMTEASSSHHPKLKILIAEDDETSEMFMSILMELFGNEILKAGNGSDAVELCRNNPDLDLIMMDVQMPVMSGYDATRKIRQFNKQVVIIAQTAYGLSGDREQALEAGCTDYISKPIIKDELTALIQKYFGK